MGAGVPTEHLIWSWRAAAPKDARGWIMVEDGVREKFNFIVFVLRFSTLSIVRHDASLLQPRSFVRTQDYRILSDIPFG